MPEDAEVYVVLEGSTLVHVTRAQNDVMLCFIVPGMSMCKYAVLLSVFLCTFQCFALAIQGFITVCDILLHWKYLSLEHLPPHTLSLIHTHTVTFIEVSKVRVLSR